MTRTRRALAAALLLGLGASYGLYAVGEGRILSTVTDQNGAPLPDVKITVTGQDFAYKQEKVTDKKGVFSILILDATRNYVLTFEKEGYLTLEQPIKPKVGDTLRETFQLLPAAKPAEPTAGPAVIPGTTQAINVFNEGVTALQGGDQAGALAKFQQAAELDPKQSAAFGAEGDVYLAQGKFKEALESVNKFLELEPNSPRGLRARYDALKGAGDPQASAALEELAKADPSHETAVRIFNEGAERTRANKMDEAVTFLNRAIEIDPKLDAAYSALANYYLTRKKFKEALEVADRHLAIDPASLEGKTVRYEAYKGMGDKAKAKEAFDAMNADSGGTPDQIFRQGVALFNANNFDQAKAAFEKVLAADPNHAKTHYMMGLVYANKGDSAKAKEFLKKFLQLAPTDSDAASAKEMIESL